jgi:uncharacterized protein YjbJ (UPF0337 family)
MRLAFVRRRTRRHGRRDSGETSNLLEDMTMDKDLTQRGAENEIEGKGKELKGRIRDGVADITGNESEQAKGKAEKLEGKVQQKFGKAERKLDENV